MASAPIETLLEGKGFSCEAGGNWTSGKGQGIGCVAFGACDLHSSTTGTDPSVHSWISEGGRDDSLLEADWSRAVLLPVQSGMKGETVKWVAVHGGKGGHMIRVSRGDGSGCVAEEQNDLQEGFVFSRQGNLSPYSTKPLCVRCSHMPLLDGSHSSATPQPITWKSYTELHAGLLLGVSLPPPSPYSFLRPNSLL